MMQMLRLAHGHAQEWDAFYERCRNALARQGRRLWPKRERPAKATRGSDLPLSSMTGFATTPMRSSCFISPPIHPI